jgi:hypothetical protein
MAEGKECVKKYKLVYLPESELLRIEFIEYIADEDIERFGEDIVKTIGSDKVVPQILGDFTGLAGKKVKLLGRRARSFVAKLGDDYGVRRVAVFGVPLVIRTVIRGIMTLMKKKAQTVYRFFSSEEEAVAWLGK